MTKVTPCPVCNAPGAREFLRRSHVPVHQNLVIASHEEAVRMTRGELALAVCPACGFVFNSEFDASKLAYGADYDNTQSHSPYFGKYLTELAEHLVQERNVRNSRIVEVGCGTGAFLRLLVENSTFGNTGVGFDPSYIGEASDLRGRIRFERRFYDETCTSVLADVVICRHVIEHVPQPRELLSTVRRSLQCANSPRIYFETPCVEWILRNRVIWDLFYEHCSLFTSASLRVAFERSGFRVRDIRHVFGGQYLWLEAGLAGDMPVVADAGDIPLLAQQFAAEEVRLAEAWRARIGALRQQGKVAIWGAGAKGATLAYLVDSQREIVDCLIDVNPKKQGKYVAGTGHPIVGVDALAGRGVKTAVVMNPNYRVEIEDLLAARGISIELVD